MKVRKAYLIFLLMLFVLYNFTQSQKTNIKDYVSIEIAPEHENWTDRTGETEYLQLRVMRNNVALKNVDLSYEVGPEKMPATLKGTSRLDNGVLKIKAGTMKSPGFLNCTAKVTVDGIDYTNYINIGFSPENLQPTTTLPDDFVSFWDNAWSETSKIPLEPVMTLLPEQGTADINVYHGSLKHYKKGC